MVFWRFFWCSLVLALAAVPALAEGHKEQRGGSTVYLYHHFGDDRYPTTNVDMDQFRQQMAYLADNDYNVISLAELVTKLRQDRPLPARTVVITVDDGYRTTYTKAWPVLKELDFPFTVFLYVEGLEKGYANYLTWEQVEEMAAAGVDFQDHGYSHHRLADWPGETSEAEYRRWIGDDLRLSQEILERRLQQQPRFFAIPYGEYNHIVLEEAEKIGYEAILTQDGGSVSDDTDPLMITREPILGQSWSTMEHFREVLERVDLPFTDMTPGLHPLTKNPPARIGARLLYPERYLPGTIGVYVSELGWQPAEVDGDFAYIENDTPLSRRINRVMISAREKDTGRIALRYWMLTNPEKVQ